ncbi:Chitin binding domain [Sergentomyia squamirostris]
MKTIILLVLVSVCCSQAAVVLPNFMALRTEVIAAAEEDGAAVCGAALGTKCGSDCFTLWFCQGATAAPTSKKCPENTPYCSTTTNMCVAEKPALPQCDLPPPIFICITPDTFLPHPTNCSRYFECRGTTAFMYECPPGYAWSFGAMGCKQKKVAADCGAITCKEADNAANKYIALSNNASYYGMCGFPNTVDSVLVTRCQGKLQTWDTGSNTCVFNCPAEGLFADDVKIGWYYECYKSGTKNVFLHKQCPGTNFIFDEATSMCIEDPNGSSSDLIGPPGGL